MKYVVGLLVLFGTLPAYSETAAGPKFGGWLDVADCSAISGWAWDASNASERLQVDLYDGAVQGSPFASVPAENFRADLKRVGIGDGAYGFYLRTPVSLKDGRLHAITAAISGTGATIQVGTNTLSCPADATGYNYYFNDTLATYKQDSWLVSGDANVTADGLTSASSGGAALISRVATPDGSSQYEVRALLDLKESGGVYTIYLHASLDAIAGPAASGSYYALELTNPTFTDKGCTATVVVSKRSSGRVTELHRTPVTCHEGMVLRGVAGADGNIGLWVDHWNLVKLQDFEIEGGQPGVGVREAPADNTLTEADLGQLDRIAPGPIEPADVQVSAFADRVELQWPRLTDDPDGTGVGMYTVARDGNEIAQVSRANPSFVDKNVTAGGVYTYEISAYDIHLNRTSTFVTAAVPAAQNAKQ